MSEGVAFAGSSGDGTLRALEAVPLVAAEYGLPASKLKPCIAVVLDGNIGGASRHRCAFTLAMELLCNVKLTPEQTARVLKRWCRKVGYSERSALRAIPSAQSGKYRPPGLRKSPLYAEVLQATCDEVGCPALCTPFASVYQGPKGETWSKFERLGWGRYLIRHRHAAARDYYRALCLLEQERGLACGARLIASYRQIADRAERDYSHVGQNLDVLVAFGLVLFEPGSGSGPRARDRRASIVSRVMPIPPRPRNQPRIKGAIKKGRLPTPDIGSTAPQRNRQGTRRSGGGVVEP